VAEPLLAVEDLHAWYGSAHIVQGVSFHVGDEPVALIGRNGMGKTTLCNAIMQIRPARVSGSITFEGRELVGRASYKVAGAGIGYVPQGRRLFESLTVDEHLRMAAPRRGSHRWTVDAVYELFPRLGQRRKHGGMQLSGGEQQMLAIARALLLRPRLLLLDEPSLGLAPMVTRALFEVLGRVKRERRTTMLLVEQNANLALELADQAYVLEAGRTVLAGPAEQVSADDNVRRSYLGY
jgi:branched-chain amino acid transport system ATP-binding protein